MFEKYIDKIINSTDDDKMHQLRNVLSDTILYVKNNDAQTFEKIECDLYEIANGKVLSKEKAIEWVNNMTPKANWSWDEVEQIKNRHQTSLPILPAYTIMNMLFSDFGDVLGEEMTDEVIEKYIRAAEDWYYDEDASKTEDEKLYYYWKCIVSHN